MTTQSTPTPAPTSSYPGQGHSYWTELRLRTQAEDVRRHADWLAASADTQARAKAKREAA